MALLEVRRFVQLSSDDFSYFPFLVKLVQECTEGWNITVPLFQNKQPELVLFFKGCLFSRGAYFSRGVNIHM